MNLWLRIITSLAILPAVYEAYLIAREISSKEFSILVRNMVVGVGCFSVIYVLAGVMEYKWDWVIPILSSTTIISFWAWVAYYLHIPRLTIERSPREPDGRRKVSSHIDEIISELRRTVSV